MKRIVSLFLLAFVLTGCSSWNLISYLHPYRIDIQQGNLVTQDMLDKLKLGMSPAQVRYALGTPLIVDPFHPERWDYVYQMIKDGKVTVLRHVTVVFEDDKLKGISGDIKPSEAKPAASSSENKS